MTLLALAELARGVLDPAAPVLHADDEGVLRGRAVFETLRVYGGSPFKLDAHLERLARLGGAPAASRPPSTSVRAARVEALARRRAARRDAPPALDAGREGGGTPPGSRSSRRCRPGSRSCAPAGSARRRPTGRPALLAGAKSTSYAENIAAQDEAAERGADDALLVAPDGTVLEAPTSNVWFREATRCSRRRSSCRSSQA